MYALAAVGELLASASEDGTVRVWDVAAESCAATFDGRGGPVYALALLGNGLLAGGAANSDIKLWDVAAQR